MVRIQKIQSLYPLRKVLFRAKVFGLIGIACLMAGCAQTYATRGVNHKVISIKSAGVEIPDDRLLDVHIKSFDPGSISEDEDEKRGISNEIRRAEGYYMAVQLRNAMQHSGYWGAVRVVPAAGTGTELLVEGRILESDGEALKLEVTVSDARGVRWVNKEYSGVVDTSVYKRVGDSRTEPFQFVFRQIANDISFHLGKIAGKKLGSIRTVAELRFAADFAPDAFTGYLKKSDKIFETSERADGDQSNFFSRMLKNIATETTAEPGDAPPEYYRVNRMPSEDDPMLQRVRRIRVRENDVVDALDRQYGGLADRIQISYTQWRSSRLTEMNAIRGLETKRNEQQAKAIMIGVLGIAASVALGSQCTYCGSSGAAIAGVTASIAIQMAIKATEQASEDSEIHKSALEELGQSLAADVEPTVIEVEGETVQLKGTAEAKFKQWRQIMKKLYKREVGPAVPVSKPPDKIALFTN